VKAFASRRRLDKAERDGARVTADSRSAPERAAEMGHVDETPPRGECRHAAVEQGGVHQVAADGLKAPKPDVTAHGEWLVGEQAVKGARGHVVLDGDAVAGQLWIVQMGTDIGL
jgi:hypothetical protein